MEAKRVCLIHYHEVGLKGKNRAHFEQLLRKNVRFALRLFDCDEQAHFSISRISGHELLEFSQDVDADAVASACAQVPGVAKVSIAFACDLTFEAICEASVEALEECADAGAQTFKVEAKRSNRGFEMGSMELNREVGAVLCRAFPQLDVDVHTPDACVRVLVNQDAAYVWAKSLAGVGGLPVGSAGKCVALFSSGFDSPVATWMMGRRGAIMVPVHFSGRPEVSADSEWLCEDLVEALAPSGAIGRMYVVPFGAIQKRIALAVPDEFRILMYRRLMFVIAEKIARTEGAKALVTGESLGQVASQTLENMYVASEVVHTMPVLRPLVGSDKQEIIERARELGTYDISSQVAPDACTLFMPKNPATHAKLDVIERIWSTLNVDALCEEALSGLEYKDFGTCASYKAPSGYKSYHSELLAVEA